MQTVYYALPSWERLLELIQHWESRPAYQAGLTYNITPGGVVLGVPGESELIASVVGTESFGIRGSDVDFGVLGTEVAALPEGGETHTTVYTRAGVRTVCEYRELGEYAFMALPEWRLWHDVHEYARAAAAVHALGVDAWLALKRGDKVDAYRRVGITCQGVDGTYAL